jgi:hypothetical protein
MILESLLGGEAGHADIDTRQFRLRPAVGRSHTPEPAGGGIEKDNIHTVMIVAAGGGIRRGSAGGRGGTRTAATRAMAFGRKIGIKPKIKIRIKIRIRIPAGP